jgi:phage shock protein PspC (stress-responsive transcriptional regulator)
MLFRYPPNGTITGIQGGLAMQHDNKLGTMKLILSSDGRYHRTTILILILVLLG